MTQAIETGYKLKLIFPCNCEEEKLRSVPSKEALFRSSRLISSVVGIKELPPESLLNENCSAFFESCGFDTDNVKDLISSLNFHIEKMFYPYGLIISCNQQFGNLDAIADWIKKFDCHFKLHNVFNLEENRAEWVIYDYPIILIEYHGTEDSQFEDFFKNKLNCYPSESETYLGKKMLVCDPVICIEIRDNTDQILHSDTYQIIEVIAAIKQLSSNVRMSLGKIAKDQEQPKTRQSKKRERKTKWLHRLSKKSTEKEKKQKEKEPLLAIQEKCEIIHELDCKNIFHSSQQRRLYQFFRDAFGIAGILKQVESAKDHINYLGDMRLKEETGGIDRTLFITGYLGLVLNTFALFSINMSEILMASTSTPIFNHLVMSLLKCSTIILVLLTLCIFLIYLYKKIVHKAECLKALKNAVIISAVIAVLLVIMFFVPFANPVRNWLKSYFAVYQLNKP